MMRYSTLFAFNEAKNSLKSWFIIREAFLAHGLADLEALGASHCKPLRKIGRLGCVECRKSSNRMIRQPPG